MVCTQFRELFTYRETACDTFDLLRAEQRRKLAVRKRENNALREQNAAFHSLEDAEAVRSNWTFLAVPDQLQECQDALLRTVPQGLVTFVFERQTAPGAPVKTTGRCNVPRVSESSEQAVAERPASSAAQPVDEEPSKVRNYAVIDEIDAQLDLVLR